ncbi:hypothetical protein [Micromonospora aurantiaca (nom. illeg.)]|uniref:hypothetical protein n=1 Tax=Micromonospora aurantiaca (nom. illeg.) TaxID=47850 RepID=UPI003F4A34D3
MSRWLTPRWLLGHLVVGVIAALCLRLGWWQWQHALQGNTLSYGYALQWPLFAAFGVFFWMRVVRDRLTRTTSALPIEPQPLPAVGHSWSFQRTGAATPAVVGQLVPTAADPEPQDDPEAVAYAHMLQWLNADPRRRLSDYPGVDGH